MANEEECPARAAAACPCSLAGCHRCWWWRRDQPEADPDCEARVRVCHACLAAYDRALEAAAASAPVPSDDPPPTSPFLCGRLEENSEGECHILALCCCTARAGSVYTDSSDDVASLAGSDSLYCDERGPRRARSAQISKIVEYFERKGADFTCERWARGPSRYRLSGLGGISRTDCVVDVRHRLEERRIAPHPRLTICEGAVKSKLPLFDKKT